MIGVLVLEPPRWANEAARGDLAGRGGRGDSRTHPGAPEAAAAEGELPTQPLALEVGARKARPVALGMLVRMGRGWWCQARGTAGWSITPLQGVEHRFSTTAPSPAATALGRKERKGERKASCRLVWSQEQNLGIQTLSRVDAELQSHRVLFAQQSLYLHVEVTCHPQHAPASPAGMLQSFQTSRTGFWGVKAIPIQFYGAQEHMPRPAVPKAGT